MYVYLWFSYSVETCFIEIDQTISCNILHYKFYRISKMYISFFLDNGKLFLENFMNSRVGLWGLRPPPFGFQGALRPQRELSQIKIWHPGQISVHDAELILQMNFWSDKILINWYINLMYAKIIQWKIFPTSCKFYLLIFIVKKSRKIKNYQYLRGRKRGECKCKGGRKPIISSKKTKNLANLRLRQ